MDAEDSIRAARGRAVFGSSIPARLRPALALALQLKGVDSLQPPTTTTLCPGLPAEKILDVYSGELLKDPIAGMRRLHAWLGEELAVEVAPHFEEGRASYPRARNA